MFDMVMEYVMLYPRITIIIAALLIVFFTTLVNFFVMDKEKLKEIKERQKKIQEEMKEHQKAGDSDKVMALQKEMLSAAGDIFKQSFKPMIITTIPVLVFFVFIKNAYAETVIAGSWFWWYLGGALISSIVFRKLFRLP